MYSDQSTRNIYRQFGPDRRSQSLARFLNRRLLVVEDDADLWLFVERIGRVVDADLVIDFAATTNEAIDRMSDRIRYDAVLVDYCLPKPGEGDTLRCPIEALQPWARLAMMSSLSRLEPEDCDFLPKPFSASQCSEFLSNLLL